MTRKECFEILGLPEKAGLAEVKSAYRRLAFELHPDLHPEMPDAAKKFQRLNEAYVLLLNDKTPKNHKSPPDFSENSEDKKARHDAGKAYTQAKQRFDKDRERDNGAQDGRDKASFSGQAGTNGQPNAETAERNGKDKKREEGKAREDVLKDILDDPFARRVFEDIYRQSQQEFNTPRPGGKKRAVKPVQEASRVPSAPGLVSSIAGGVASGVRNWLRRQSDDEQTIVMPGSQLVPGARIRIKVHHGLAGKTQTVELTLPPEFMPGQPVRLKGLGKKVGSIQGDLYLTLIAKKE